MLGCDTINPTLPGTLNSTSAASSTAHNQHLTPALAQALKISQMAQYGPPNPSANAGPQPPFSPEVMRIRKEYTGINSPLFIDTFGESVDQIAANQALERIKKYERDRKRWPKEHDLDT